MHFRENFRGDRSERAILVLGRQHDLAISSVLADTGRQTAPTNAFVVFNMDYYYLLIFN